MLYPTPVCEQLALSFSHSHGHVAQRLEIFLLRFLSRHKGHFRVMPLRPLVALLRLPSFFRNRQDRDVQGLAHPCADGKTDEPSRPSLALLVSQPVHQTMLMAGRVAAIVKSLDRRGQRRKSPL